MNRDDSIFRALELLTASELAAMLMQDQNYSLPAGVSRAAQRMAEAKAWLNELIESENQFTRKERRDEAESL